MATRPPQTLPPPTPRRGRLRPTLVAQALWQVSVAELRRRGVRGVVLDLDNTLVAWNGTRVRPEVRAWVEAARAAGLRLCLASNALGAGRVRAVGEGLGMLWVPRAGKPLPRAFRRAMAALGTEAEETCAIGDQVFTDLLGASWLGLTTVLLQPLSPRESPHTRLIRLLEWPLRRWWARG